MKYNITYKHIQGEVYQFDFTELRDFIDTNKPIGFEKDSYIKFEYGGGSNTDIYANTNGDLIHYTTMKDFDLKEWLNIKGKSFIQYGVNIKKDFTYTPVEYKEPIIEQPIIEQPTPINYVPYIDTGIGIGIGIVAILFIKTIISLFKKERK